LGLEGLGVEQEQRLPGAHRGAFLVEPFLDDAGDARAHLGILRTGGLSDVFEGDREGGRLDADRRHLRRRKAAHAAGRLLLSAAGSGSDSGQEQHG
jgi:hypothetical protein